MIFREATVADIGQIQLVRHSVKENVLSDPSVVTDQDCADYLTRRGKGWVCEINGTIRAFAIADLVDDNIWALFVDPGFEGLGIGKKLHDDMLDWYFQQQKEKLWLSTSPGTRAEQFYSKAGWKPSGIINNEARFEITREEWLGRQST